MADDSPARAGHGAAAPEEQRQLVARLHRVLRTLHGGGLVEQLETHISYVLLAGGHAYKIKKAVKLDFLDFSTLPARHYVCRQELRLNRRYAPQLYLAVVPITGSIEDPAIGGDGIPIEYAVQMRAFAQEGLASRMLGRGALHERHIAALARCIAAFHDGIARAEPGAPWGTASAIGDDAIENFTELGHLLDGTAALKALGPLREWTAREAAALANTFSRRREAGFVRECHGDLHLENIALVDGGITPFDGIEFNDGLRWIDVMNEIAFLLMDLHYRGRHDLAWRFLNDYLEHTGDHAGLAVLRFYVVYRALVRAKVACLRATQMPPGNPAHRDQLAQCERHIALARSQLRPQRRALVITHGYSGCGKTTMSQGLLAAIGAVRIRSDTERKRLAGLAAHARSGSGIAAGLYRADSTDRTYRQLLAGAEAILDAGHVAIVDGTFLMRWQRQLFRELARVQGVPFAIITFEAPLTDLRARIGARRACAADASEADLAVLEFQLATAEELAADELPDEVRHATEDMTARASEPATWRSLLDKLGLARNDDEQGPRPPC